MNIFCHFGSPLILHSDNGREFVNQVIHALLKLWPDCQMINGKARHSQSQGSVERCNRDIENMLACWQKDNSSNNWAHGLQFVMYAKNAVGDTVLVPIPDLDRGRCEYPNLKAVVLEEHSGGHRGNMAASLEYLTSGTVGTSFNPQLKKL